MRRTAFGASVGVPFDCIREASVLLQVGTAHDDILTAGSQRFGLDLCDRISPDDGTAGAQGCLEDRGLGWVCG
jgi:hypothetical protein